MSATQQIPPYRYGDNCNLCGRNVRALREKTGLTQEQLAAQLQCDGLNITQMAISRMETGDRVIADYEVVALARIFGVTLDALLSDPQPT